jgi:fumarylacetoacetase
MDKVNTNTEKAKSSWIKYDENNHFPIENLPFGVGRTKGGVHACYTRVGDNVVNLAVLEKSKYLHSEDFPFNEGVSHFDQSSLNSFISLGRKSWVAVRTKLTELFHEEKYDSDNELLKSVHELNQYVKESDFQLVMPFKVAEYTDFYSSKNHAFNMGSIIRGPTNALQPNWSWLPVGYHGKIIFNYN